ncbi:MAG: hypothetical protein K5669_06355, partial [Lachnospiraceae bacterium]|nr:hypothetical protein [Lachnospiraceae bacterium]
METSSIEFRDYDSFSLRPFIESIIEIDDNYYYSSLYGGDIVKVDIKNNRLKILYKYNGEDSFYLYHFSVIYKGYIYFTPKNADNILCIDIYSDEIYTVEVKERYKNEVLSPYKSKDHLLFLGLISGNLYQLNNNELTIIQKRSDKAWVCYRTDRYFDTLLLWNKGCVKIYQNENDNISYSENTDIICISENNGRIVFLDNTGSIFYNTKGSSETVYLKDRVCVSNYERLVLSGDECILLPKVGNTEIRINIVSGLIEYIDIPIVKDGTIISWSLLDNDNAIAYLAQKKDAWMYPIHIYELSIKANIVRELPLEKIFYKGIFSNKSKIIYKENSSFYFDSFIDCV